MINSKISKFLFLLLICCSVECYSVQADSVEKYPTVGLIFYTTPFMADTNGCGLINFHIGAFGGYVYDKFSFRIDAKVRLANATRFNDKSINSASINILSIYHFKIMIVERFAFVANTGFGWQRESKQLDSNNLYSNNYFDLQLGVGCEYYPKFKYIYLSGISDFNLYFGNYIFKFKSTNYLRLNVVPYINLINFFGDIGVCYEYSSKFENTYPYFNYQIGIKFQFDFKQSKTSPKKIIIFKTIKQEIEKTEMIPKEPEKSPNEILHERYLELYKKSFAGKHKGDVVTVANLSFPTKSIDILPGTAARLNALAEVLIEKNIDFAISCYIEATGSPEEEFNFATKRANTIKYYLVARGVRSNKIKISANAIVYPVGTPNTEKIIEIKILK